MDKCNNFESGIRCLASGATRKIEVLSNITQSEKISISSGTYVLYAESDKKITRGVAGKLFTVGRGGANLTIGKADAGGILTIDGNSEFYSDDRYSTLIFNDLGTLELTDNAVLTNDYETCVHNSAGAFTMSGGIIKDNVKEAVSVGYSSTFKLSGTAQIPPGDGNKNYIYLNRGYWMASVTVNGDLTEDGQTFMVTPGSTDAGSVIAKVDGTIKTVFEDGELSKFSLSTPGKTLDFNDDKTEIQIKDMPVVKYSDDDGGSWTNASTLKEAFDATLASGATRKIEVLSNITQSEGISISSGTCVLYAESDKKITRGVTGRLFEVGRGGANLTIGKADAGGTLTIDGDKDNYSSGILIYNDVGGMLKLTENAVFTNNAATCVSNSGGAFTMSGGIIKDNAGHAVNINEDTTFNLSGNAQIPPRADGKNDIYLYSGRSMSPITVNGDLTEDGQTFMVTPGSTGAGSVIAKVDGMIKTAFEDGELGKFSVNAAGKSIGFNDDKTEIQLKELVHYSDDDGGTWTGVGSLDGAFSASLVSGKTRQIEVLSDITQNSLISISSGTYVLYAESNKTITRGVDGNLFTVGRGANLTIGKSDAGGTLTIDGDKDNYSSNTGSLVYNNGGTLELTNNVVLTNNSFTSGGSGVCNYGTFTMSGGTISNNIANGNGGGVFSSGTFAMSEGTISGNTAKNGGGVSGDLTMSGGTIKDNEASENGGGVSGNLTMDRGTIKDNEASQNGGAVYNDGRLNLSGTAQIPPGDGNKNDIYMPNGKQIKVDGDLSLEGKEFMIKTDTIAKRDVFVTADDASFISGGKAYRFVIDSEEYVLRQNGSSIAAYERTIIEASNVDHTYDGEPVNVEYKVISAISGSEIEVQDGEVEVTYSKVSQNGISQSPYEAGNYVARIKYNKDDTNYYADSVKEVSVNINKPEQPGGGESGGGSAWLSDGDDKDGAFEGSDSAKTGDIALDGILGIAAISAAAMVILKKRT